MDGGLILDNESISLVGRGKKKKRKRQNSGFTGLSTFHTPMVTKFESWQKEQGPGYKLQWASFIGWTDSALEMRWGALCHLGVSSEWSCCSSIKSSHLRWFRFVPRGTGLGIDPKLAEGILNPLRSGNTLGSPSELLGTGMLLFPPRTTISTTWSQLSDQRWRWRIKWSICSFWFINLTMPFRLTVECKQFYEETLRLVLSRSS